MKLVTELEAERTSLQSRLNEYEEAEDRQVVSHTDFLAPLSHIIYQPLMRSYLHCTPRLCSTDGAKQRTREHSVFQEKHSKKEMV